MQTHWLTRRPGHRKVMIAALGWASSPAAAPTAPPGYDLLCLCDYRSWAHLDPAEMARYEVIDLAAWSFGVLMAELTCSRLPLRRALAFNGSPMPVHDRFGIPVRSFRVTLNAIRQAGIGLFFERAYGGAEHVPPSHLPQRSIEELAEELETLYAAALHTTDLSIPWSGALIGSRDAIFPPHHLQAFWGERGTVFDAPHYPFADASFFSHLYAAHES